MKINSQKIHLHPIMTFVLIIIGMMVLSALLALLRLDATYVKINPNTNELVSTLVTIESLLSIDGLKYIFSNTVSNFVAFAPLSMLIITLIGIGIMEKSGFLKTIFTILTRNVKKNTVTFYLVLVCILSSVIGDLSYVIMMPLSALLYLHGKRNPLAGVTVSFAALTFGSSINLLFTAKDSALLTLTLQGAHILDPNYGLGIWCFLFVSALSVIGMAFIITNISERITAPFFGKYELNDEPTEVDKSLADIVEEDKVIDVYEKRGLKFSLIGSGIYLLFFLYNIIPGLPFSGRLLDDSQILYIDKLFSYDSFFSNGFVFIMVMLFIIAGLLYGIGAKTIKNNRDVCDNLGHSLDGIGKTLVLILFASTFIGLFKYTNIGTVLVAKLANLFDNINFSGIPLVLFLFIVFLVSTILIPVSTTRWQILAGSVMPVMMNAGISPEFTQFIFKGAEAVTSSMTPLFAYFVIYLALLQKYNQDTKPIGVFKAIRYQLPYILFSLIFFAILIVLVYIVGLPIGINGIVKL